MLFIHPRRWASDPLRPDDLSPVGQLVAGGLGGIAAWGISYPIDVIKSRMQTYPEYKGILDCAVKSYRAEGHRVFFAGLGTTVIRSFPVNAVIFLVYEVLIKAIPV
jgi:solute carrier family 25 carnitine/acylcarnitine transporter 20/29